MSIETRRPTPLWLTIFNLLALAVFGVSFAAGLFSGSLKLAGLAPFLALAMLAVNGVYQGDKK